MDGILVRWPRSPVGAGGAGYTAPVSLGVSLFLIAAGAILRYAVTWRSADIDIPVVGLILMIVGIIGLIFSIAYMFMSADRARADRPVAPPPRDRDPYR